MLVEVGGQDLLGGIVLVRYAARVEVPADNGAVAGDAALVAALGVGVQAVADGAGGQPGEYARHLWCVSPWLGQDAAARYGRHTDDLQALVGVVRVPVLEQSGDVLARRRRRLQAAHRFGRVDPGHAGQPRALVLEAAERLGEPYGLVGRRALRVGQPLSGRDGEQVRRWPCQAQPPRRPATEHLSPGISPCGDKGTRVVGLPGHDGQPQRRYPALEVFVVEGVHVFNVPGQLCDNLRGAVLRRLVQGP